MGVAPASPASLGQNEILPGGHIHNDLVRFRVSYHGAPGDLDDQGLSPLAAHVPALAVLARLGGILALIAEIQQGGQIVVDPQDHATPMAPVSPIGAAGGHIFLPVEGHGAVAALAAQDCNPNFIYKHINLQGLKKDCREIKQQSFNSQACLTAQRKRSTSDDPCPCAQT